MLHIDGRVPRPLSRAWRLMRDAAAPRRVPVTVFDVLVPSSIALIPTQRRPLQHVV
jgi:hypothetical protein